jgi:NAD-dependent dihydropyrimidine dehydrogenase PreA subunit
MQICPQGVFDWSDSGRAAAQNPGACIRCGRCLQVCPAGAITVSA